MHKSDYEQVANAICEARVSLSAKYGPMAKNPDSAAYHGAQKALLEVAQELADQFELENANFSRARFLHAALAATESFLAAVEIRVSSQD